MDKITIGITALFKALCYYFDARTATSVLQTIKEEASKEAVSIDPDEFDEAEIYE